MSLQEFFEKLGAFCRSRQSDCEGCDFRIFCYTPPVGQSQESVALVERLLDPDGNSPLGYDEDYIQKVFEQDAEFERKKRDYYRLKHVIVAFLAFIFGLFIAYLIKL